MSLLRGWPGVRRAGLPGQSPARRRAAAERSGAALTTQGRALGYSVVAALQDPRKDVLTIRNLSPTDRHAAR